MADVASEKPDAGSSNEPVDDSYLVEPRAEPPPMRRSAPRHNCIFCGNPDFRRSRLRFVDALPLLLLQFPIRCTRCGHRQRASVLAAAAARPSRRRMGL